MSATRRVKRLSQYLRSKITKIPRLRLARDAEAFRIREISVDDGERRLGLQVLLSEVRGSIVARRQLLTNHFRSLSELPHSDAVFERGVVPEQFGERAVRRKPVARSGQDVSIYGFSSRLVVGMVIKE